jgi:hypothetical protein
VRNMPSTTDPNSSAVVAASNISGTVRGSAISRTTIRRVGTCSPTYD